MTSQRADHPVLPGPTSQRTRIACDCGFHVSVEALRIVDADRDSAEVAAFQAGKLNAATCPRCQAVQRVEVPVTVYDPGREAVFICLPASQRHRTLQALVDYFGALASGVGGGPLPPFVLRPILVLGVARLGDALEARDQASLAEVAARDGVETARHAQDELQVRLGALSEREGALELRERTLEEARYEQEHRAREADELSDALRRRETDLVSRGERLDLRERELDARASSLDDLAEKFDSRAEELGGRETAIDEMRRQLELKAGDVVQGRPAPAAPVQTAPYPAVASDDDGEEGAPTLVTPAVGAASAAPPPTEPQSPAARDAAQQGAERQWSPDIDEAWGLDVGRREAAEPDRPATGGGDHSPTVRFSYQEGGGDGRRADVEVLAPAPTVGPFAEFDTAAAGGRAWYVAAHEDEVFLCQRVAGSDLDDLLSRRLDLRVQLHRLERGPVVALLLVCADVESEAEAFWWLLDVGANADRAILERLAAGFSPSVVLFDGDRRPRRRLPFQRPLERNVRAAIDAATAWLGRCKDPSWEQAAADYEAPGYDRIGAMRHPFSQDVFGVVQTPAQARFGLGVLDYWLRDENRDYLTLVKSFPATELEAISRRVIKAALDLGIALNETTMRIALDAGLTKGPREAIRQSLAAFAEVALRLRPHDLDDVAEWENWQQLLEQAEASRVEVDPSILTLAENSMERVRSLVESGPDEPARTPRPRAHQPPPPPPSDEEGEEDPGDQEFTDEDLIPEREAGALSVEDLVRMLGEEGADASAELARRSAPEVARALVRLLAREDVAHRERALDLLGGLGQDGLKAVCEGIKGLRRGSEALDDALAALDRSVGRQEIDRLGKDRSRKVRDAARRVVKQLRARDGAAGGGGPK